MTSDDKETGMSDEKATNGEEEMVSYLLSGGPDKEFVIEIPRTWKITFATVNPNSSNGMRDAHCVRVYEMPGSKLRAVFDSIHAIRDMAIPLARKVRSEVGNSSWTRDSTGNFSESSEVKVDRKLVPDTLELHGGEF